MVNWELMERHKEHRVDIFAVTYQLATQLTPTPYCDMFREMDADDTRRLGGQWMHVGETPKHFI